MPINRRKKLVDTVREYANDPDCRVWEDHNRAALHIETLLGGNRRHLRFDDITGHSLNELDDQQRAAVVAVLFANADAWPMGTAEVRVNDGLVIPEMVDQTDIYVFVNNVPVSQGARISTPMTTNA